MIGKLGSQPLIQPAQIDQSNSELENAKQPAQPLIPPSPIVNASKSATTQTGDYMMSGQLSRLVLDKLLVDNTVPKQTGEAMTMPQTPLGEPGFIPLPGTLPIVIPGAGTPTQPETPTEPELPHRPHLMDDPNPPGPHVDPEYPVVPHDGPTPSAPAGPNDLLMKGSYGPEVTKLQQEVNFWRATQGEDPIAVDGKFGDATQAALKEFQQANGLKADGLGGPNTKAALEITCTPMDETARSVALTQLQGYADNPAARANLLDMIRDPAFRDLSGNSQYFALGELKKNPADQDHAANMLIAVGEMKSLEANPAFQNLSEANRNAAKYQLFHYADKPLGPGSFSGLMTDPGFGKLDSTAQKRIMDTIFRQNDPRLCLTYQGILNSNSFAGMDDRMKDYALALAEGNAKDGAKEMELDALMNNPLFAASNREQQLAQLKQFEWDPEPDLYR